MTQIGTETTDFYNQQVSNPMLYPYKSMTYVHLWGDSVLLGVVNLTTWACDARNAREMW
jgi:hypothetical protein